MITLRPQTPADNDGIWRIFHAVIQAGDSFVFDATMTKQQALDFWLAKVYYCVVAEQNNKIIGTYIVKANPPVNGSYICNASYLVDESARGLGLGYKLGLDSLEQARKMGFRAMQFNIVASSNTHALRLWEKLGFTVIGTTPNGFKHRTLGYIDSHIIFKSLIDGA